MKKVTVLGLTILVALLAWAAYKVKFDGVTLDSPIVNEDDEQPPTEYTEFEPTDSQSENLPTEEAGQPDSQNPDDPDSENDDITSNESEEQLEEEIPENEVTTVQSPELFDDVDGENLKNWNEQLDQLQTENLNSDTAAPENPWILGQPWDSVKNVRDFKLPFDALEIALKTVDRDDGDEESQVVERVCTNEERESWVILMDFVFNFVQVVKGHNETCPKFTTICQHAQEVFTFSPEFFQPVERFPDGVQPQDCAYFLDRRLLELAGQVMKFKESQVCSAIFSFCESQLTANQNFDQPSE